VILGGAGFIYIGLKHLENSIFGAERKSNLNSNLLSLA